MKTFTKKMIALVLAIAGVGQVMAQDSSYGSKVYRKQGGDQMVVASGGTITVESGGSLTVDSGATFSMSGTLSSFAVTGNTFSVGTSTLSVTGGKVGIGTASPAKTLHVVTGGSEVRVSSSATSSQHLSFGGAYGALPTSGFGIGAIVYLLSDSKVYVATDTVTGTDDWQAIGAQ